LILHWGEDTLFHLFEGMCKNTQIPASRNELEFNYKNIIQNKDSNYYRTTPVGYINAKDVSQPSDIALVEASCLVKMSEVNFECFKQSFNDPESRVKLTTELDENHHSVIERIQIFGGYLDGFDVHFSQHLNTFIGGRGTGKTTLLELIRYALDIKPKSPRAQKTSNSLIDSNIGVEKGRIELTFSSHKEHGKRYKVIKRYADPVAIIDMDGESSNLKIEDLLPTIEVIGQNEIVELIDDDEAKVQILDRFLPNQDTSLEQRDQILRDLKKNRESIVSTMGKIDELEQQVQKLPGLEEQLKAFDELGVKDKLSDVEKLSQEEEYFRSLNKDLRKESIELPKIETPFADEGIDDFLYKELFKDVDQIIYELNQEIHRLNDQYKNVMQETRTRIEGIQEKWRYQKEGIESEIHKLIKEIPDIHGKSGRDIAEEYRKIVNYIARIKPLSKELEQKRDSLSESLSERNSLLENLRRNKDAIEDELRKTIKKINKKHLKGKVKIDLHPRKIRRHLIDYFTKFSGLAERTLEWINNVEDLSVPTLCEDIDRGAQNLFEKYKEYGLTKAKADIIANMSSQQRLELDEIELLDDIDIQLNIDPEGETYKSLEKLSKGQQCTAVLNILLLDNKDSLIIDQPEDNWDNAFIANNIVNELRGHKMNRQFIFATHNANIPVFGDAELIGVLQEEDGQGAIKEGCLGSVDSGDVKKAVIQTLEGGDSAFKMRRAKYNL
jgi:ABC-type lipoprotein export system ATPase subunit